MRFLVGGLAVAGVLAAVACGGKDGATTAPASNLTLADLPVKLPSYIAGTYEQTIDHGTDGSAPLPVASAATDDAGAAPPVAGADPDAGVAPTTFTQRYWYNPAYSTGPDSPVLLYICGESACSSAYGSSLADSARTLGASIIVLEHRYYGASIPFGTPNLEQMKYLTIHNALEDLAAFEKFAVDKHALNGKWIAVGGSYPGMLAAFYRLKHPELVAGAWASSAPIGVVSSFSGYDALASRTLGPECSMLVRQAEDEVDAKFADPAQRAALIERVYGPLDEAVAAKITPLSIKGMVMGGGKSAAQYGSTHYFCGSLKQHESDPLEGYFQYTDPTLADDPVTPDDGADAGDAGVIAIDDAGALPLSPGGDVRVPGFPAFVDPDLAPAAAPRQIPAWTYQTCREVGFFQVHNSDRTQSVAPVEYSDAYFEASCAKQFHMLPNIAGTRSTYFDPIASGQATNILFVNGSADPWSSLSLTDPSAVPAGISVLVVRDGSHCEDLTNLYPGELAGVFEAHLKFNQLAKEWLAQ